LSPARKLASATQSGQDASGASNVAAICHTASLEEFANV
jgi:hypothetical protein